MVSAAMMTILPLIMQKKDEDKQPVVINIYIDGKKVERVDEEPKKDIIEKVVKQSKKQKEKESSTK